MKTQTKRTSSFKPQLVFVATALTAMPAFGATSGPRDAVPTAAPTVAGKRTPLVEALAELQDEVQAAGPGGLTRRLVHTPTSAFPLREAIKRMLPGWSYVLYPSGVSAVKGTPGWRLLILSAPEGGAEDGSVEPSGLPPLPGSPMETAVSNNGVPSIQDLLGEASAEESPIDLLMGLAQGDADPGIRAQALALLAERAEDQASPVLETALFDPAPEVRQIARSLMEHLDEHLGHRGEANID